MLIKPFDCGILVFALCAVVASFFAAYSSSGGHLTITVKNTEGEWVFPLDAAETVRAPGPLGDTIVEIRDGGARVLSSPCANQTCVASGSIHSPGQWTACLPNRVMVVIRERADKNVETDVDATAW